MIRTVVSVDVKRSPKEQPNYGVHNRWHPEIPPVASVKPGEVFRVECLDWLGGQIGNNDSALDIINADLTQAHYLSGPISVEGAEPGDYLEVEILDVQPLPGEEWGYSGIFPPNNGGGGFLADIFKTPAKAIWNFEGIYATSRHIPGVRFPGIIHPGIMGTAPTHELLEKWNSREQALVNTDPHRVNPLAYLPNPQGAYMGSLERVPDLADLKSLDAARTIPPREHGGNCDIKNLSRGSKAWFPVYVAGANFSTGDIHFSQGDGEVTFCGGIEMSGVLTLKFNLIKNGMLLHGNLNNPIFMPGPVEPRFSNYLTFEGISVDDHGQQHYLDASISFRQAILNCITYLKRFGFSAEQAYIILTASPCEGRIASIVDVPSACCTMGIPTEIFAFDITPKPGGHLEDVVTSHSQYTFGVSALQLQGSMKAPSRGRQALLWRFWRCPSSSQSSGSVRPRWTVCGSRLLPTFGCFWRRKKTD